MYPSSSSSHLTSSWAPPSTSSSSSSAAMNNTSVITHHHSLAMATAPNTTTHPPTSTTGSGADSIRSEKDHHHPDVNNLLLYRPTPLEEAYAQYLWREHLQMTTPGTTPASSSFKWSGRQAVPFLSQRSGVSRRLLRNMWTTVDPHNVGTLLQPAQLYTLLRLTSLAQAGLLDQVPADNEQAVQALRQCLGQTQLWNLPLPAFEGIPRPPPEWLLSSASPYAASSATVTPSLATTTMTTNRTVGSVASWPSSSSSSMSWNAAATGSAVTAAPLISSASSATTTTSLLHPAPSTCWSPSPPADPFLHSVTTTNQGHPDMKDDDDDDDFGEFVATTTPHPPPIQLTPSIPGLLTTMSAEEPGDDFGDFTSPGGTATAEKVSISQAFEDLVGNLADPPLPSLAAADSPTLFVTPDDTGAFSSVTMEGDYAVASSLLTTTPTHLFSTDGVVPEGGVGEHPAGRQFSTGQGPAAPPPSSAPPAPREEAPAVDSAPSATLSWPAPSPQHTVPPPGRDDDVIEPANLLNLQPAKHPDDIHMPSMAVDYPTALDTTHDLSGWDALDALAGNVAPAPWPSLSSTVASHEQTWEPTQELTEGGGLARNFEQGVAFVGEEDDFGDFEGPVHSSEADTVETPATIDSLAQVNHVADNGPTTNGPHGALYQIGAHRRDDFSNLHSGIVAPSESVPSPPAALNTTNSSGWDALDALASNVAPVPLPSLSPTVAPPEQTLEPAQEGGNLGMSTEQGVASVEEEEDDFGDFEGPVQSSGMLNPLDTVESLVPLPPATMDSWAEMNHAVHSGPATNESRNSLDQIGTRGNDDFSDFQSGIVGPSSEGMPNQVVECGDVVETTTDRTSDMAEWQRLDELSPPFQLTSDTISGTSTTSLPASSGGWDAFDALSAVADAPLPSLVAPRPPAATVPTVANVEASLGNHDDSFGNFLGSGIASDDANGQHQADIAMNEHDDSFTDFVRSDAVDSSYGVDLHKVAEQLAAADGSAQAPGEEKAVDTTAFEIGYSSQSTARQSPGIFENETSSNNKVPVSNFFGASASRDEWERANSENVASARPMNRADSYFSAQVYKSESTESEFEDAVENFDQDDRPEGAGESENYNQEKYGDPFSAFEALAPAVNLPLPQQTSPASLEVSTSLEVGNGDRCIPILGANDHYFASMGAADNQIGSNASITHVEPFPPSRDYGASDDPFAAFDALAPQGETQLAPLPSFSFEEAVTDEPRQPIVADLPSDSFPVTLPDITSDPTAIDHFSDFAGVSLTPPTVNSTGLNNIHGVADNIATEELNHSFEEFGDFTGVDTHFDGTEQQVQGGPGSEHEKLEKSEQQHGEGANLGPHAELVSTENNSPELHHVAGDESGNFGEQVALPGLERDALGKDNLEVEREQPGQSSEKLHNAVDWASRTGPIPAENVSPEANGPLVDEFGDFTWIDSQGDDIKMESRKPRQSEEQSINAANAVQHTNSSVEGPGTHLGEPLSVTKEEPLVTKEWETSEIMAVPPHEPAIDSSAGEDSFGDFATFGDFEAIPVDFQPTPPPDSTFSNEAGQREKSFLVPPSTSSVPIAETSNGDDWENFQGSSVPYHSEAAPLPVPAQASATTNSSEETRQDMRQEIVRLSESLPASFRKKRLPAGEIGFDPAGDTSSSNWVDWGNDCFDANLDAKRPLSLACLYRVERCKQLLQVLVAPPHDRLADEWMEALSVIRKYVAAAKSILLRVEVELTEMEHELVMDALQLYIDGVAELVRVNRLVVSTVADLLMLDETSGMSPVLSRDAWSSTWCSLSLLQDAVEVEEDWKEMEWLCVNRVGLSLPGSPKSQSRALETLPDIRKRCEMGTSWSQGRALLPRTLCRFSLQPPTSTLPATAPWTHDRLRADTTSAVEWNGDTLVACAANFLAHHCSFWPYSH